MTNAIVQEQDINIAHFYAESLLDYYISEYYQPGQATNVVNTEDPNNSKSSSI
jgi:hypothetical protein